MVYQDHLTKFCVIRPLTSKRPAEVAFQLLDVFLLFDAPHILQSDNGTEFTAQVINELKDLWPELVIVHGKPRHPESQGSVERANSDVKDMVFAWMADNNTNDWTVGLKFVQFQKNNSHHTGIGQTPFLLKGKYSRNQFDVCAFAIYNLTDMKVDASISLRRAVKAQSKCGGQGVTKCNCAGSKRCQTNRCKCYKAKVLCNSRCHGHLSCKNKNWKLGRAGKRNITDTRFLTLNYS